MTEFANVMTVFAQLEKSNCRQCNEKTCLVFAARVFKGERALGECLRLPDPVRRQYQEAPGRRVLPIEHDHEAMIVRLKKKLRARELRILAQTVQGDFEQGRLTLRILGKPLSIERSGRIYSDIHANPWLHLALLDYLLQCRGLPLAGRWVPFRELEDAAVRTALFVREAEAPLKRLADAFPRLFEELILLFKGERIDSFHQSDISLVLTPLPRLPVLICYWQPAEGMESDLHLFFDATAVENSSIETVFGITTGLVRMFEKIAVTHGWRQAPSPCGQTRFKADL
jgi:hypothetical protein